jgi:hypothetical protein
MFEFVPLSVSVPGPNLLKFGAEILPEIVCAEAVGAVTIVPT